MNQRCTIGAVASMLAASALSVSAQTVSISIATRTAEGSPLRQMQAAVRGNTSPQSFAIAGGGQGAIAPRSQSSASLSLRNRLGQRVNVCDDFESAVQRINTLPEPSNPTE